MRKITTSSQETVQQAFERFLLSKKAIGAKDKTLLTYSQQFGAAAKHLDVNKDIACLYKADFDEMIASMRDSELSPNSIETYTALLHNFLSWCNQEGLVGFNIRKYKGEETIKETYTDEELSRMLKKPDMKKCGFPEYRTWVIINLLVNNGCRASTVRNIQIRDVDFDSKLISARHTKNKKALVIPLCSEMSHILKEYLRIRKGELSDYLFCNESGEQLTETALHTSIVRFNRKRGVQKTGIHMFRHTFARKYLVDCGGDAFMLQKLLGHSTLGMTKHYCAIFDSDITKDYDKMSPLSQLKHKSQRISLK